MLTPSDLDALAEQYKRTLVDAHVGWTARGSLIVDSEGDAVATFETLHNLIVDDEARAAAVAATWNALPELLRLAQSGLAYEEHLRTCNAFHAYVVERWTEDPGMITPRTKSAEQAQERGA